MSKNKLKKPEPEIKEKPVKEKRTRNKKSEEESIPAEEKPKKRERKPFRLKLKMPAWVEDERFQKIMGGFFMMFSFYLLIAFVSYLFTWQNDQDKIDHAGIFSFLSADVKVENWLGKLGAILSHQFIGRWFGVASFLFVLNFFLIGFKGVTGTALLPIKKTIKLSALYMVIASIALGFLVHTTGYVFIGGAFGYEMNEMLNLSIGRAGTAILLLFTAFVIAVIYFNPSFKRKPKEETSEADGEEVKINVFNPIKEDQITKDEKTEVEFEKNETKIVSTVEEEEEIESEEEEEEDESEFEDEAADETEEDEQDEEEEDSDADEDDSEETKEEIEDEQEESEEEHQLEVNTTANTENETEEFSVEVPKEEAEVSEKDIAQRVLEEFGEYDPKLDLSTYIIPSIELLNNYGGTGITVNKEELEANKNRILDTLKNYSIEISKIKATIGPTVTLYEIIPAPGVRISKIKNLEDDIALSLSALGIRIIAPIPGKGTIGIEVPNSKADTVSMRSLIASEKFQNTDMELPIALGKTITNETFITDLAKMPHLLMAGATGQGKSVGLNAVLVSILYKKHPAQVKFVLVDPKKVELTLYNKIERHFLAKLPDSADAIITDNKKVIHTLNSLCIEMDDRYELLKDAEVRNIKEYNAKFILRKLNPEKGHKYLPYIVLVVDEFADLIMTAGKEVETPIARLAQLARAIGIHLIIATQRPSVNIITGTIKANFPARIAFRVTSKIDSRTILDAGGAEQLIGRGDMLLSTGNDLVRIQCGFVDTPEVEAICEHIGGQRGYPSAFLLPEFVDENAEGGDLMDIGDRDDLFDEAARTVVTTQQGSASMLQRKLKLGYNRAGRLVDQLEQAGILGPYKGSKAREVLYKDMESLEQFLKNGNSNNNFAG
jgi:S-DNA-T family DNA segregation ATPase FtsK/SpoIIIE